MEEHYRLKEADLDRECSQGVRDEVAVKLDDWEMTGRCLESSMLGSVPDVNSITQRVNVQRMRSRPPMTPCACAIILFSIANYNTIIP